MRHPAPCSFSVELGLLLVGAGLALSPSTFAATRTWSATPTSGLWSLPANWGGTAPAASGDDLVLGTSSLSAFNQDIPGLSVTALTVNATAPAFTLTLSQPLTLVAGGSLTLATGTSAVRTLTGPGPLRIGAGATPVNVVNNSSGSLALQSPILSDTSAGANLDLGGTGGGTLSGALSDGPGPLALSKSGSGTWTLQGAHLFSGPTTVTAGTLSIAAGATLGGTSQVAVSGGTFNLLGTLTSPLLVPSGGAATLGGGASAAAVVANGNLTFSGSPAATVQSLSGSGQSGIITVATEAPTTVTVAPGTHSFFRFTFTSGSTPKTLTLVGTGAEVTVTTLGLNGTGNNANWSLTLQGGNWTTTGFSSNSGAPHGTFRLTGGASLRLGAARFGQHGTWLVNDGTLTWLSGSTEGAAGIGYRTVIQPQGSVVWQTNLALSASADPAPILNSIELLGGSATLQANLTLGSATAGKNETNQLLVSAGKLRINGTLSAATTLAGQTHVVSLTGGTVVLGTVNSTNLGGTLVIAGSTLHPGDVGTPGRLAITGGLTLSSGTLALDIGSTSAATTAFATGSAYDNLSATGPVTLGGQLSVSLPRPFIPVASDVFTLITSSSPLLGDFANAPADGTTRITTAEGLGTFILRKVGNTLVLTDYVDNFLPRILASPEPAQFQIGQTATLSVSASHPGGGVLTYQWFRDGVLVPGATSADLILPQATLAADGLYHAVVSTAAGSRSSGSAYLHIIPPVMLDYRMDQPPVAGADAILDATGRTAGTLVGSPLPLLAPGASAQSGSSYDFSQTGSYLTIRSSRGGLRNFGNLTNAHGLSIAFWYKPDAPVLSYYENGNIARLGSQFSIGWALDPFGTAPKFNFGDGVSAPVLSNSPATRQQLMSDGLWHFFVITLDYRNPLGPDGSLRNNVIVYADGEISGGYPGPGPFRHRFQNSFMPQPSDVLNLGMAGGRRQHWDNFTIFNYALSQAEIDQLHTTGSLSAHAPQINASASTDLLVLPQASLQLSGEVFNFGQALPVTATWSVTSAPAGGTVTFGNSAALATSAIVNGVPGTYVLTVTADNTAFRSDAHLKLVVLAEKPLLAFASADGRPEATALTGGTVRLQGSSRLYLTPSPASATYAWSLLSGPAAPVFANAAAADTTATFPAPGTYVLQLAVTNAGVTRTTTVTVRVADEWLSQVVGQAEPQLMLWPAASAQLSASATQTNPARPVTYAWSLAKGPGTATFTQPAAASSGVTFSAPGVYQLRLSAQNSAGSAESFVWVNVWPPGPGNEAGILPPQPRRYRPQPAPFVHPRLLFTAADRPDLLWRAQNSPGAVAALAAMRGRLAGTLDNPAHPTHEGYQRLLAGDTTFSSQPLAAFNFITLLGEAAYLCWLEDENHPRLRELGTVFTNALRDELTWNGSTASHIRFIGIAYDLTYNHLTEEQRDACRALIGPWTRRNAVGFQFIDQVYGAAQAIYGEPGYDEALDRAKFEALRGAFVDGRYTTPQGWKQEDTAYGGFTGWGINPAAHFYRQFEPLIVTGNVARENYMEFNLLYPDNRGGIGGHSEGGWAHSGLQYLMHKFFYPEDPLDDLVRNANVTAGIGADDLYEAIFALPPLTPTTSFAAVAAARRKPLSKFDPNRGIGVARSDWSADSLLLSHDMRRGWGGHVHASVNELNLVAEQRQWFVNPGYGNFPNERHTTVLIDGVGSGRNPARMVDVLDRGEVTAFVGDARHAYTYTSTQPVGSATGVSTGRLWRQMIFPGSSDGFFPPGVLDGSGPDQTIFVPANGSAPSLLNPVERAFRTSAVIRGPRPYLLVLDDIQKDALERDYTWVGSLPPSVQTRPGATATEAVLVHQSDTDAPAAPQLLLRVLDAQGTGAPITVGTSTYNSQSFHRVHVPRRSASPDFRLLLYPHRLGEPSPATTWSANSLTVSFFGEYTDHFTFDRTPDGRTRLRSFSRSLPGRSAPTVTTPAALSATADAATLAPLNGEPGAALSFAVSAVSDTGTPLAVTAQSPSGTVFPAGHSLVYASATDALGQTSWRTFPVTVRPAAPALVVTAVAHLPGAAPVFAFRWDGVARATAYSVKRASAPEGPYTVVSDRQFGVSFTDSAPPAVPQFYVVTSWADDLEGPPSAVLPILPPLGDFTGYRLGTSAAQAGFYRQDNTLLLNDTNGTFSSASDTGVFAAYPWTGDGVFTVRLAWLGSQTAQNSAYSVAALMLRTSTQVDAITALASPASLRLRTSPGGSAVTTSLGQPALPRPVWLRLQRQSTQITATASADGITWQGLAPTATLDLPAEVLVGPFLCGSATALQNARFEEVTFLGTPTASEQAGAVRLSWTSNSGLTFRVERAPAAAGPFTTIASDLSAPSYTDAAVTPGTIYHYRVVATALPGGVPTISPAVSGFVLVVNPSLPKPTNLTVTPGFTANTLTWTPVPGSVGQVVRRATSAGGPFNEIAVLAGDAATYTDTRLLTGTAYFYTVSTRLGGSESVPGTAVAATPIPGIATRLNNAFPLSEGPAWSSGTVPTLADTALWSGAYDSAPAAVPVGSGLSARTVRLENLSRPLTVTGGTGPLTVGAGGIELSTGAQTLTVAAPLQLVADQTWTLGANLTLSGGLGTSGGDRTVTLTGPSALTLTGSAPITGLRLRRPDGGGSLVANFSTPGGVFITLPPGTHGFATLSNISPTGQLTLNAPGATVSVTNFGYSRLTGWTLVLRGGTWNFGTIGGNGTGLQNGGTFRIEADASLTVANGSFGAHGTWLVGGDEGPGRLTFNSLSSLNGGSLGFVVYAFADGTVTFPGLTVAQADNNIATANDVAVTPGGLFQINGGLTVGNTNTGKSETNFVRLVGGVLRVTGTVSAATATAGQTRRFEWSAGQLTAATITPSVGFDAPSTAGGLTTTALVVPPTGILAPGDVGTAGRTVLTGDFVPAPSAVLDLDLGGTTQASAYQTGQYDLFSVTGTAALAGELRIRLINSFSPAAGQSFTVLTAASLSGGFTNAPALTRIATESLSGSFLVTHTATGVVLSDYRPLTALELWRHAAFGQIAPVGPAADLADPDGDGVNNLLEYALATDPLNPGSAGLPPGSASGPSVSLLPAPGSTLQFSFLRARPELTYTVEATSSLTAPVTWTTLATNPGSVSPTVPVTVTDSVNLPTATPPRRYLRLRVTAP